MEGLKSTQGKSKKPVRKDHWLNLSSIYFERIRLLGPVPESQLVLTQDKYFVPLFVFYLEVPMHCLE